QSTLAATRQELSETDARLATLAGNLASRSGYDPTTDLDELNIGFVVLADAQSDDASQVAVHERIVTALDGSDRVSAVGVSASGLLWRVATPPQSQPEAVPGNTDTVYGKAVLAVQAGVFLLALLLAVPTSRRRRRVRPSSNA